MSKQSKEMKKTLRQWKAIKKEFARCKRCGLCCRVLWFEPTDLDALREPRIAKEGRIMIGGPDCEPLFAINSPNNSHWCIFLRQANRCDIYATRPNECVSFEPGGDHCNEIRESAELEE